MHLQCLLSCWVKGNIIIKKKATSDDIQAEKLSIKVHKELLERLKNFCGERDIPIEEFIADAIVEKLNLAYKCRRKRPRL